MRTRTRGSPSWPTTSRRKAGYVFADCSEHQTQTACRRGEPYVYPRCRNVSADGGTIDAVVAGVRHHLGQGDRHDLPGAGLAPAPEPPVDRVPLAVLLRHVAPRSTATQPPQNAVQNRTVLGRTPSATTHRWLDRQQILQDPPLCFAQIAPAQSRLQKEALNQPPDPASTNLSTPPRHCLVIYRTKSLLGFYPDICLTFGRLKSEYPDDRG